MKTGIVIQARMGSARLPGKVLMPVTPRTTVLDWVLTRTKLNRVCDEVILATTTDARDDVLQAYAVARGIAVYRGSELDVLARYLGAAETFGLDAVVRITSDCPLIEPSLIAQVIETGWQRGLEYVTTEDYPRGSGDVEFVLTSLLERIQLRVGAEPYYREHVTTYIADHLEQFNTVVLQARGLSARPDLRLCVDEMDDLSVVQTIAEHFAPRMDFTLEESIAFLNIHLEIATLNSHVMQKTLG